MSEYETIDPADAALADDLVDTEPAAEPAAEPAHPESAAEPVAPPEPTAAQPWGPDPNAWQQVTETIDWLAQNEMYRQQQQAPAGYQQAEEPEPFDPYNPDALRGIVSETVQTALAPLMPTIQYQQQQQAAEQVDQWLGQIEKEVGAFDKEAAANVARSFLPLTVTAFQPNGNPQLALRQAAEYVQGWEKRTGQQAVDKYKADLGAVAAAPSEPSVSGSPATEVVGYVKGEDELAVARRLVDARRLTG